MSGNAATIQAGRAPSTRASAAASVGALAATMLLGLAQPASAHECSQPVGEPGAISDLAFERTDWALGGGLHMTTYDGHLDRNLGVVEAATRTVSDGWLEGDRGAVLVVLRNDCGDVIGVTRPQKFGVASRLQFWRSRDATVRWTDVVDPQIAARTASVDVVHDRAEAALPGHFLAYRQEACGYWRTPIAGHSCPVVEMFLAEHND